MPASRSLPILSAAALLIVPDVALAQSLTPVTIFFEAAPSIKAIILALVVAAIAAVVVTIRKVATGSHLTGGSAYLSALRLGAPLLGLLGATYNALLWFIAMARVGAPTMQILAPGLAEATFLVVLGLLVGVVGVVCHWIVEARVDRAVLRA
ncbi:MotA/TolQ/ExbB proton channel family protein [Brevundimonas sp.]|uniref:MotA/TolQ/ExbB proton channel family protein n=1 Tax=Brevundimonas sp. TaxID=1871086 RepID=UPI003D11D923